MYSIDYVFCYKISPLKSELGGENMKLLLSKFILIVLIFFLAGFFTEVCVAQDREIYDMFLAKIDPGEVEGKQVNFQMIEKFKEDSSLKFRVSDPIFIFLLFYLKKEKIIKFEFFHFGLKQEKFNTNHLFEEYQEGDMYLVKARFITSSFIGDGILGSKFSGTWNMKVFFDDDIKETVNVQFDIK